MNIEQIQSIQANEKGFITIMDGLSPRTFVKEKILEYLKKNTPIKYIGHDKLVKKKLAYGVHKKRPVIAILKNGTEIKFLSQRDAADYFKIDKSNIPKVLSGKYRHVGGIKFRMA